MFSCLCVNLYFPQFSLFSTELVELVYWSGNNQMTDTPHGVNGYGGNSQGRFLIENNKLNH